MSQVAFTLQAEQDLEDIRAYIARDKPRAAEDFVSKIEMRCRMLAGFPELGTPCDELESRLRCFSVGTYLIFFRRADDGILVVRVLSASRNIEDLFS